MKSHRLLDGTRIVLKELTRFERDFLRALRTMIKHDASYFDIYRFALGPGSPALQGSTRVDWELLETPLYRVSGDLVTRAGIDQGLILAPQFEHLQELATKIESPLNVVNAADLIGITRIAVYKAIKEGRLKHVKIGNVLLVRRADALAFKRGREERLESPARPRRKSARQRAQQR